MKRRILALTIALAFAGCAPTTEWKLREINETSVKARGDDPNIVWEESVVIVAIDYPKEFPEIVDIRNPRIESKEGPVISGMSATVAGSDKTIAEKNGGESTSHCQPRVSQDFKSRR